jgi:predicted transcriptional regulator
MIFSEDIIFPFQIPIKSQYNSGPGIRHIVDYDDEKSPANMIEQENLKLLNTLVSLLNLSQNEARIFLLLTQKGKCGIPRICSELELEESLVTLALNGLVDHGMIFKLTSTEFQSFHPRFSVANCHRMNCQSLGIGLKMNSKIDALGTMLENYYEFARPK